MYKPTKAEKIDLRNAILAAGIGIFLFVFTNPYQKLLDFVTQKFGSGFAFQFRIVSAVGAMFLLFAILQFFRYWRLWNFFQAVLHELEMLFTLSPIVWSAIATLALLFSSLLYISKKHGGITWDESIKISAATFYVFSGPMIFIIIIGGWWLGKQRVKKEKNIIEVLSSLDGLLKTTTKEDKDPEINDILFTLENCHFILLRAITFSRLIGYENPNAIEQIQNLLDKNPDGRLFVLLQCPFCKNVIKRSIELDVPYDEEYRKSVIESMSNCLAAIPSSDKIMIALSHGKPYIRGIFWGRFKKKDSCNPLNYADYYLSDKDHFEYCEKFMSYVEWGGFTLQEYLRGQHGHQSPLYQGSTLLHGAMWNELRKIFANDFIVSINLDEPLGSTNKKTLEHLAYDFGMPRIIARWMNIEQLCKFTHKKGFTNFINKVHERAKVKRKPQTP